MPERHRPTTSLRIALVTLLVLATASFAVGAFWERSQNEEHPEPAAAATTHEASEGSESDDQHHDESAKTAEVHEHSERLLGVDVESPLLLIAATLLGVAMALVAALHARRGALMLIALVCVIWAILDVREIAHLADESQATIAVLAGLAALTHLAAAACAIALTRQRTNA